MIGVGIIAVCALCSDWLLLSLPMYTEDGRMGLVEKYPMIRSPGCRFADDELTAYLEPRPS